MRSILDSGIEEINTPTRRGGLYLKHLCILCAFQFFLGIFYIGSVPRIYADEAWDASLGYELAQTGILRHPFINHLGGMEIYYLPPRVMLPIICAGIFKVAGYSIAISRLPALLFGTLAIIVLYNISKQFFRDKEAFFICLFAVIHPWFWSNCRRCRPEMLYTALALILLWLMICYFRRSRLLTAFLAGIITGLSSLSHPNGLLITVSIGIGWLVWKEKSHLLKFIMWALAGFILAILPYVIYVLWATRHPDVSFVRQMHSNLLGSSVIAGEITRWQSFLRLPFGFPLGLVMFASWLAAWWKSTRQDKFAATAVTIYILVLPMFSVNDLADYLIPIIPLFSMLIVRLIFRLPEFGFLISSKRVYYATGFVIMLIYVVSSLPLILFMLYWQHSDADFNKVVNEVTVVVGPNERIHADPIFWVGHDRYNYGPYLMTYDPVPITIEESLQWAYFHSFDYAVRTIWIDIPPRGFWKPPQKLPEFRLYFVTDNLCKLFGTKVHEFYSKGYGPIEIYKIDWSRAAKLGLKKQDIK
ncbi:MAG: glycosyltransferase family 39 protein [Sedimentisphaerales bacterium]|nr:glycosyltransferase family 39 protein [Sedimentisphaerales bacterium]